MSYILGGICVIALVLVTAVVLKDWADDVENHR